MEIVNKLLTYLLQEQDIITTNMWFPANINYKETYYTPPAQQFTPQYCAFFSIAVHALTLLVSNILLHDT